MYQIELDRRDGDMDLATDRKGQKLYMTQMTRMEMETMNMEQKGNTFDTLQECIPTDRHPDDFLDKMKHRDTAPIDNPSIPVQSYGAHQRPAMVPTTLDLESQTLGTHDLDDDSLIATTSTTPPRRTYSR